MKAQRTHTPEEPKRLIAKAVAAHIAVKKALGREIEKGRYLSGLLNVAFQPAKQARTEDVCRSLQETASPMEAEEHGPTFYCPPQGGPQGQQTTIAWLGLLVRTDEVDLLWRQEQEEI